MIAKGRAEGTGQHGERRPASTAWLACCGIAVACALSSCGKGGEGSSRVDSGPLDVLAIDVGTLGTGGNGPGPGVSTLAGSAGVGLVDGPGDTTLFSDPINVAVGPDGYIYVADFRNGAIRRVTPSGEVRTLARGLDGPAGLAFDRTGSLLVSGDDGQLRRIDVGNGSISPVATGLGQARGVAALPDGRFVTTALKEDVAWLIGVDGAKTLLAGKLGEAGLVDGVGGVARFDQPIDVVFAGGVLLVADLGNDRVRSVTLDGVVTTFAGTTSGFQDGALAVARFDGPSGLALDGMGNVYVSDRFNGRIRKITPAGKVMTVAGNGTLGFVDALDPLTAEFAGMEGIDFTSPGALYIADGDALALSGYERLRQVNIAP